MNPVKLLLLVILLFGAGTSGGAFAEHFYHGARLRVYVGPPVDWAWHYPPPSYYYPYPYYYPPVIMAPSAPPVYIEQGQASEAEQPPVQPQAQSNYWYYCNNPDGYYPYIKQCPGGWKKVPNAGQPQGEYQDAPSDAYPPPPSIPPMQ